MNEDPKHAPSVAQTPTMTAAIKRQALLLSVAACAAGVLCLLLGRAALAQHVAVQARETRAAQVAADARAIAALRVKPQQATETGLQLSDILERVTRAMQKANLKADTLISTLAQPPRRPPGSDHAEVVHRLIFERVTLEALTRFCHTLVAHNAELTVSGLHLRAGPKPSLWNADVSVSYWLAAPRRVAAR